MVLAGFSCATDFSPAGIATERPTPRNSAIATVASASPPPSCVSTSAAAQTSPSQCLQSPNGSAAGPTSASVTKSNPSKPKPRRKNSSNHSSHSYSPFTSDDGVSEFRLLAEQTRRYRIRVPAIFVVLKCAARAGIGRCFVNQKKAPHEMEKGYRLLAERLREAARKASA